MAERLLKAGYDVVDLEPHPRQGRAAGAKSGGKMVDKLSDLAVLRRGVLHRLHRQGSRRGLFRPGRLSPAAASCRQSWSTARPFRSRNSAAIRKRLKERGADYVAAPVSGNAKVIKAGKLSAIVSGPEAACKTVMPLMEAIAPRGVAYAGEGELARVCKIAHNVMLGVVIENLIEITLLTNKMGVPRHAFLAFLNNSVMGSMFTAYKSPALVNLDWTTTFTPELLRKDLDLGLELGREMDVPMPVTAATREVLQSHFGAAMLQPNPEEYIQKDFAALAETMALAAGMKLDAGKQERADAGWRLVPSACASPPARCAQRRPARA